MPLSEVSLALKKYMVDKSCVQPEHEAIKFYFSNHVFSLLNSKFDQNIPLPEKEAELAKGYVALANDLTVRLIYYCLMITTREARHLHGHHDFYPNLTQECGSEVSNFIKSNCGGGEESAVGHLKNNPPKTTLGNYTKGLVRVVSQGGFSSGYGGGPWAKVAETVDNLVRGVITPEMFSDTAWTLAHNNGPIFNKGMLYSGYGKFLYKLLDVQRSGQVPQLISDVGFSILSPDTHSYVKEAQAVFPKELSGYVDWYKVEALGSLHKYPKEKAQQTALYGESAVVSKPLDSGSKYWIGTGPKDYALIYDRGVAA